MIPKRLICCVLGAVTMLAATAIPAVAQSDTLTVGVFLPQATFADNAARSRYAERLAAAVAAEIGPGATVDGRAFGRRADVEAFLKAGKLDILICDGLFAMGRKGRVAAHGVDAKGEIGPAATLFAAAGTARAFDLKGAPIAVAAASDKALLFYANTALEGEVDPGSFFGAVQRTKDANAALGAVKAGKARAAFAPAGHPAASGLTALASGGRVAIAVALVGAGSRDIDEAITQAALRALKKAAGSGGGIAGWRSGKGAVKGAQGAAKRAPKVKTAKAVLASSPDARVALPRVRVEARGLLPAMTVGSVTITPQMPPEEELR